MSAVLCLAALGFASCKKDAATTPEPTTEQPTPTNPSTPTNPPVTGTKYTITFETNGGNVIQAITVNGGTALTLQWPIKKDNGFQGWYTDSNFKTKFESNKPISADIKVYAKWVAFATEEITGGVKIINFNLLQEENIIIPRTINDKAVLEISSTSSTTNTVIKNVTLPESLKTIGQYAFSNCNALETLFIPPSVETIANYAFKDCKKLMGIDIGPSVKTIGEGAFSDCNTLMLVNITSSIPSIKAQTFFNCKALKNITIPNSVTSIEGSAFANCEALTKITIPALVENIGDQAFINCKALTEVFVNATTRPTLGDKAFYDTNYSVLKIKVPVGKKVDYQTNGNWATYTSMIEEQP
ncbi:MAG: leucine-rich repeat protein [Sphingobacteriaceae bacterium]|nr:leucine-rich repeat protein [Sphingobacteriaceae bacterium]